MPIQVKPTGMIAELLLEDRIVVDVEVLKGR